MSGHGEKLSRNKERVIVALLACPSIGEAAKKAKIGEATIHRWLKDEGFQKNYKAARRQAVQHGIVQIQSCLMEAVNTLKEIMDDKEAQASARVSAAKTIIDVGIKAVEIEHLEDRIEEIEKIVKENHR